MRVGGFDGNSSGSHMWMSFIEQCSLGDSDSDFRRLALMIVRIIAEANQNKMLEGI